MKRLAFGVFGVAAVFVVAAEFILPVGHGEANWWDLVPAFYALFGFVSCVLIVVASKALGKAWLQRKEDYYE